jgi:hypothetical protein
VAGPWFQRRLSPSSRSVLQRRARRLKADVLLVEREYPGLSFVRGEQTEFVGTITIGSCAGIETPIKTNVVIPNSYPDIEPVAFEVGGRFPKTRDAHFADDGSCCLWLPWETGWDGRRPEAILAFLGQVVVFFHRQLVYEATGYRRWPGGAWEHGQAGYGQYVSHALAIQRVALVNFLPALSDWQVTDKYQPCPCGSGKKLRWCHGPAIEELMRHVGRRQIENRAQAWLDAGVFVRQSDHLDDAYDVESPG